MPDILNQGLTMNAELPPTCSDQLVDQPSLSDAKLSFLLLEFPSVLCFKSLP